MTRIKKIIGSPFVYNLDLGRFRHLDFLRGMAVLLVLFRHHKFFQPIQNMGWIGVDLFFVLSGYLISNLLFNEYHKKGKINVGRFLIRRGFKIYPLFYFAMAITVAMELLMKMPLTKYQILSEVFFVQNYLGNFWDHTWSLAVEEHFYLILPFFLMLLFSINIIGRYRLFLLISTLIFILSLWFRLDISDEPYTRKTHYFASHLRFDSLFVGVAISYWHKFYSDSMRSFYNKLKNWLLILPTIMISTTIFFFVEKFFMRTYGFTLIAFSFGAILIYFLNNNSIERDLDSRLGKKLINAISNVGIYSYAIYVFHLLVKRYFIGFIRAVGIHLNVRVEFIMYFGLSILIGWLLTKYFEQPLLDYRNQRFPR